MTCTLGTAHCPSQRDRLAVGPDPRENSRESVTPWIDGFEVHREDIAGFAAFDVDRADDRVVLRRPRRVQRVHVRVAHELVHLRVVAVILDEARQRVVRLDLKRLLLLDVKHRLVSCIECVLGHFATSDDLHRSAPSISGVDRVVVWFPCCVPRG